MVRHSVGRGERTPLFRRVVADEPVTIAHLLGPAPEAEALEVELNLGSAIRAGHGLGHLQESSCHDLADHDTWGCIPRLVCNQPRPRPEPQPAPAIAQDGLDDILEGGLAQTDALKHSTIVLQHAPTARPNPQTSLLGISYQSQDAIDGKIALVCRKPTHLLSAVVKGEKAVGRPDPKHTLVVTQCTHISDGFYPGHVRRVEMAVFVIVQSRRCPIATDPQGAFAILQRDSTIIRSLLLGYKAVVFYPAQASPGSADPYAPFLVWVQHDFFGVVVFCHLDHLGLFPHPFNYFVLGAPAPDLPLAVYGQRRDLVPGFHRANPVVFKTG